MCSSTIAGAPKSVPSGSAPERFRHGDHAAHRPLHLELALQVRGRAERLGERRPQDERAAPHLRTRLLDMEEEVLLRRASGERLEIDQARCEGEPRREKSHEPVADLLQ